MIERTIVEQILDIAKNAPSGDNMQPWQITWQNNGLLEVFNDSGSDDSPYNFMQWGSLISHGALAENIFLAAASLGYETEIIPFPSGKPDCVFQASFHPSNKITCPLSEQIPKRTTNRTNYRADKLTEKQKDNLKKACLPERNIDLGILENNEDIAKLAKLLSHNEEFIITNRFVHDAIYKTIRWNKGEESRKNDGLYIKTFELMFFQAQVFRMLGNWKFANFFSQCGLTPLITKDSEKKYRSCAGYLLISARNRDNVSFYNAGRVMERVWLTAGQLGLDIQPCAGLLYLSKRVEAGNSEHFTYAETEFLKNFNENFRSLFQLNDDANPTMLLRIGRGGAVSARSKKKQIALTVKP